MSQAGNNQGAALQALYDTAYALFREVRNELHNLHEKEKEAQEAIVLFDQVIAIDPSFSQSLTHRAECYFHLGNTEQAIKDFLQADKYVKKFEKRNKARLADIYTELGENEKAIEQYTQLIEHCLLFEYWYDRRGKLYRKIGNTAAAEADEKIFQEYQAREQAKWDDPNHYYHYK